MPNRPPRWSDGAHEAGRSSQILISVLVYTSISVAFFFVPLAGEWPRKQLGSALFAPDNVLNAGILEWGRWSILHGANPFDWPAGYPMTQSLAGTENLLGWQLVFAR